MSMSKQERQCRMFSRIGLSILAAGIVMCTSPVTAQMTGSRLGKNATSADAEGVLNVMVRCVGERNPTYAARVMQAMPGSAVEHKAIWGNAGDLGMCMDDRSRRLVIPDNVEMRMTARSFRFGLATVMARESLKGLEPAQLTSAPAWSLATYRGDSEAEARRDMNQLGLYQFGDCVVAAKPAAAAQLVIAGPDSAAGKAAVQAMMPALGPCLNEGTQITLTEATLATAVAEPIYFRARALRAGGSTN